MIDEIKLIIKEIDLLAKNISNKRYILQHLDNELLKLERIEFYITHDISGDYIPIGDRHLINKESNQNDVSKDMNKLKGIVNVLDNEVKKLDKELDDNIVLKNNLIMEEQKKSGFLYI
jgi:hypothetical protein